MYGCTHLWPRWIFIHQSVNLYYVDGDDLFIRWLLFQNTCHLQNSFWSHGPSLLSEGHHLITRYNIMTHCYIGYMYCTKTILRIFIFTNCQPSLTLTWFFRCIKIKQLLLSVSIGVMVRMLVIRSRCMHSSIPQDVTRCGHCRRETHIGPSTASAYGLWRDLNKLPVLKMCICVPIKTLAITIFNGQNWF